MRRSTVWDVWISLLEVFNRDGWRCQKCGAPGLQVAHKIPQDRAMLKRYGAKVIHHSLNLVTVCGLACNDAVSISNHPMEIARLVAKIKRMQEDIQ